jgi:cytochrome c551/c552
MNRQFFKGAAAATLVLSACGGAARAQKKESPMVTLDKMVAEGRSQRELAQHLFDTHGCKDCHTTGEYGRLGFTKKGQEKAQGFEGCTASLKAMTVIAKVPAEQRSATQKRRAERFEEFGCATCHKVSPGSVGFTEVGARLAKLHLGCVDVEKVLASKPK